MSLDITLNSPDEVDCICSCGNEHTKSEEVFSANITHNLTRMANAAGIYLLVWRPEELGIVKAKDVVFELRRGITRLKAEPEKFRALEPENKWGTYDTFVPWLEKYLKACEENPEAVIEVSR